MVSGGTFSYSGQWDNTTTPIQKRSSLNNKTINYGIRNAKTPTRDQIGLRQSGQISQKISPKESNNSFIGRGLHNVPLTMPVSPDKKILHSSKHIDEDN